MSPIKKVVKKSVKTSKVVKKVDLKLDIEKGNKRFAKLTAPQKRVAIAKDVLLSIKTGIVIPTCGNYFSLTKKLDGKTLQEGLCDVNSPISCKVCGMGAVFVSKVKLGNTFEMDGSYVSDDEMTENLEGIFSTKQLRLIEHAFEGFHAGFANITDTEETKCENKFRYKYSEPSERMQAIMKNIIKNNGTFKP